MTGSATLPLTLHGDQSSTALTRKSLRTAQPKPTRLSRADEIYALLKKDISGMRLLPGDRFTEGLVCARWNVSRTPVRQALYRLQQEGYVEVLYRAGWRVLPIDFRRFEELYDVRKVLEVAALQRLCRDPAALLSSGRYDQLASVWLVDASEMEMDPIKAGRLDEEFHSTLVEASGNRELARMHAEVTEHVRMIRRLDFAWAARIEATYQEHARILHAIATRRVEEATRLMDAHITASQAEVRKITLHQIHTARRHATDAPPQTAG